MTDKASTYDYECAKHTSVTTRSKEEENDEWRPYVGPEGGTGWTNGDEINYDDSFAPDPADIDREATEQFLQQVPEDERADAREELGIPENERDTEDEIPSDLLTVDEVAEQLEAAEDAPLAVNPDSDDPRDVAIDLVTEGEASAETVAEAVDQTGVSDITPRLVMKEITGEVDGMDSEMTLMSSYPFNSEFVTNRYTDKEQAVNRSASRGWIQTMFNEDTVPVFKVAEEQTGNSELGGGADKPTDVIERTELEPVEDEPNLPEDREFYRGQEVELLNEDTTGVVEHIHGSVIEIRTGESYLDQEVDADTLEAMRGISEKTTEAFRDAFGETVKVYRGYAESGLDVTSAESTDVSQEMVEAKEAGEPIEHDHRAAEAWTTNPEYASAYAKEGKSGAMLAREVPVEQIIMASHTTNLQRPESEIVVAHNEDEQYSPDQILTQEQLQSAESEQLILEQVLESIEDRPEMVKIDKSPRQIGLKPDPQWIHRDDINVDATDSTDTQKMNQSRIERDDNGRDADNDEEWQVYVGDRGGVGWQTTDGERRVYDDLPPGGIDAVDTDQLQDFVEYADDVDEQERLEAYAKIGLIADASGPEPAQPTGQGDPRVEVGNIAEASERVRQAPAPPDREFVDNWIPVTDSVVEGTIVEVTDAEKDANELPGAGQKAIVTELPSEGGQDGTAVLADGTSVDITLEDGLFEGTREIIQAYHDPANQVANGDSEWSDFPLGKIPESRQSELGFEDGVDIDAVSTDERLSNVFDAAAKRTNARDYGIRGGNTTGAEMDVFEYEDGSIDFGVPVQAYENISTGIVDSVDEAVRNNRDSPKVIAAFGGETCATDIVESPSGESVIVKEGLSGQTFGEFERDNPVEQTEVQDSAVNTIAASYFVGNGDLHEKNLFVTDSREVAVIDHDDGPGGAVTEPQDLGFIGREIPDHRVRARVYDMAVEYAMGNLDIPDDISDEHRDYLERAVESAITDAHDQPGYSVPDEIAPDFPPKHQDPVVDSFEGFERNQRVSVEHPESGLLVRGYVSRVFRGPNGTPDEIVVSLESGAQVEITSPDLVFDAPRDVQHESTGVMQLDADSDTNDTEDEDERQWIPYFGDRGGVGWQTPDGEQREYDDLPPGGVDAINEEALADFFEQYTNSESERQQMRELLNIDGAILSDADNESDTQDSITPEQAVERFQDTIESTIQFSNRSDIRTDEELSATVWDASLDAVSAGADPETVVTGLRDRLEETESVTDTFGTDYIIESFVYDHFDPLADSDAPDQQLVREMRGYAENPSEYPDVDVQTESGAFDTTATDLRDEIANVMADEQYKARSLRYDRGQEIFNTIEEHIASGGDPSQAVLALASAYDSNTLDAKTPDDVSRSFFRNFTEADVSTDAEQALFDELRQFDRIPESYPAEVSDIEQTIVDELFALAQDDRDISGRATITDLSWFDVSRSDLDATVADLLEEIDNTDAVVSAIEDNLEGADNESDRARFYHSVTEEIGGRETEFGEATLLAANNSAAFREARDNWITDVDSDDQRSEWDSIRSEWFFSVYSEETAPLFKMAAEQTGNTQVPTDDPDVHNVLEGESIDEIDTALFDSAIEHTRDVLREVYGDTVPCYRGLSPEGDPSDAGSTDISRQIEEAAESGKAAEVDHRTLESWSVNPLHARKFAGASESEDDGVIIKTEIPVEEILIASYAGLLTDNEDEIVAAQSETGTYAPEQVLTGDEIRAGGDARELLEQAQRLAQDDTKTAMKAPVESVVTITMDELPPVNWLQETDTDIEEPESDDMARNNTNKNTDTDTDTTDSMETELAGMYPDNVTPDDVTIENVELEEDLFEPFDEPTQQQILTGLAFSEDRDLLHEPDIIQSQSLDGEKVLGEYDHRDRTLVIDSATNQQRVENLMGYSTVDTVADLVVHEMVHAAHSGNMRDIVARNDSIESFTDFYDELMDNDLFNARTTQIEQDVSEYATDDAAEFVAEVAVERAKGTRMPPYVMRIYRELRGPELNL